jgi:hypothetical protein
LRLSALKPGQFWANITKDEAKAPFPEEKVMDLGAVRQLRVIFKEFPS